MPLTSEELRHITLTTRHDPLTIEKVAKLLDILQAIADDDFLSSRLALKGGTALNGFHFNWPRLSLDIDLNYVGHIDEMKMRAEQPEIERALLGILGANGCRIKSHASFGGKWRASFDRADGETARLEIDINYAEREPLFGATRMDSFPLGNRAANGVLVLDLREIIAAKIATLFKRTLARDIFDGRTIMEIPGLDWQEIKPAFIMFSVVSNERWENVSIETPARDTHERCQSLLNCLPHRHFGGKEGTIGWHDMSVVMCREHYGHLVDLTEGERAFVDGVLLHAVINASLLAPPPHLLGPISRSGGLAHRRDKVLEAWAAAAAQEGGQQKNTPPTHKRRGPSRGL